MVAALFCFRKEILMVGNTKFVDFEKYCKTCEYEKKKDTDSPCNECLDTCAREGTDEPEMWREKER